MLSVLTTASINASADPFCIHYPSFTATPSGCSCVLAWSYDQCNIGKYYVMYSLDNGVTYYAIAEIDARNTNNIESYTYTDNYACPSTGHTDYEIIYVYAGTYDISLNRHNSWGACTSCTNKSSTRCNSLPSISIYGPNQICASSGQSYSLSSTYPATWTITSGGSLVSMSVTTPTMDGPTLTNSSSNGTLVLNANIYGCKSVNKTITIGLPNWDGSIVNEPENVCTGAELYPGVAPDYTPESSYEWTMVTYPDFNFYLDGATNTAQMVLYSEGNYFLQATAHSACGDKYLYKNFYATNCYGRTLPKKKDGTLKTYDNFITNKNKTISAFPNPANNEITVVTNFNESIKSNSNITEGANALKIQLIDMSGTIVRSAQTAAIGNIKINTRGLSGGAYIIKVIDKQNRSSYIKVLISHN